MALPPIILLRNGSPKPDALPWQHEGALSWITMPMDNPAQGIVSLVDALKANGMASIGAVMTIPSQACLAARIDTHGLPRQDRNQTLLYRLEAQLPLAAEDVAVDFIHHQGTALGIAVEAQLLRLWVEGLENADIQVDTICPEALFLLSGLSLPATQAWPRDLLLVQHHSLDLIQLSRRGPIAWTWLGDDHVALKQHLAVKRTLNHDAAPLHVVTFDDAPMPESLSDCEVIVIAQSTREALSQAADVLHRGPTGMINLRRGPLQADDPLRRIRRPLRLSVAAMALFMLILAIALAVRGHQHQAVSRQVESAIADLYIQGTGRASAPPPSAVRLQLEAEQRRLRALSGESSDLPVQTSALLQLRELTRRLPTQLRYRITDIRIDPDRIHIDGQARTHSDADQIAVALRRQQGFVIEPPRTEQLRGQGVSYTLVGQTLPMIPLPDGSSRERP